MVAWTCVDDVTSPGMDYSEIQSIKFGVLSTEEIERTAVCMVDNANIDGPGSVYDERMGVIENGKRCLSCDQTNKFCPGHYGAIRLAHPIFHPMYYRHTVVLLNTFCTHCSRLYVSAEHLALERVGRSIERVSQFVGTVPACFFCSAKRQTYTYAAADTAIVRATPEGKVAITPTECLAIFSAILDDDVRLLGIDPHMMRPKSLVMEYVPVMPIRARPFVISNGVVCDDDITVVYQTIVKINAQLCAANAQPGEAYAPDKLESLAFHVSTLMNNSDGKSKHNNGSRPIKGIKERISGKDGIIRNNMSGKRVNQSARTVIGPDPTLCTDEVAVPLDIARTLTVPEHVNRLNLGRMQALVDSGRANFVLRTAEGSGSVAKINLAYACNTPETEVFPGDTVMRNHTAVLPPYIAGDIIHRGEQRIAYVPSEKRRYELRVGDVVERQLADGDTVLINRQPTLHKCSMLAKRVVVRPGKTLRLNLATTKVFNADFDGDEMNIHVPQDHLARVELDAIVATRNNIISTQSSKPNIAVVQDGMLGAYLMTKNDYTIPRHIFMDICMSVEFAPDRLEAVSAELPLCGRALVSLILPSDFTYAKDGLAVVDGVVRQGPLTKSLLSAVITTMHKEYERRRVLQFIDELQFVVNGWLTHFGFSIGLGDCIPPPGLGERVQRSIAQCFAEAQKVSDTVGNPRICSAKIAMALAKAKDMGMRAAKDAFATSGPAGAAGCGSASENGFVSTVTSGSKGDYFNVCQITGLLGQQNVGGRRIEPQLNNGTRTLPHYPLDGAFDPEAGGFVRSSFIRGLRPQEFFFHAMSGREGVSDTALKTAVSGYTQRKMVKILEDVQVKYDGTVRNAAGDVLQWMYGGDGLDRTQTIPRGAETDFCDIARLAARLNAAAE